MRITGNIASTQQASGYKIHGAANESKALENKAKAKAEGEKKDSKNISMVDSELVKNSNRIDNIIKRFEKQKELVRKQITQVNKNEQMTVDEKKEKLAELTDKIKMLDDEKNAAIFEENQKKLEEEKRKLEESKEKAEAKKEAEKETDEPEKVKDIEHVLKIGNSYSNISRFKQTKANMSRQAGRIAGEIANDIVSRGLANSYSEAKVKAEAGVNPYRANDWKVNQLSKLSKGIDNLENEIKNEVTSVNKEVTKYGKLKVEFAKAESKKDLEENKESNVADVNEPLSESPATDVTEQVSQDPAAVDLKQETNENNSEQKDENNQTNTSKLVNDIHKKYKDSDKKVDKKGAVIDTDL